MKKESAFPTEQRDEIRGTIITGGLSKLEYFSGIALRGLLGNPNAGNLTGEEIAKLAVAQADILIDAIAEFEDHADSVEEPHLF